LKHAFIIAGNFGTGKSSITKYHPHTKISPALTQVQGLLSLGGETGADNLNGLGITKEQAYRDLVWPNGEHDLLIHSVYYQSLVDIDRLQRSHLPVIIALMLSRQENERRMQGRKGAFNLDTWKSSVKALMRLEGYCGYRRVPFVRVDASPPLDVVAPQVWGIIEDYQKQARRPEIG
jgi:hypothetical protein